nr:LamG-like jellyroll fold domain-containing protein [uncultured Carboxylicivirga sp.]
MKKIYFIILAFLASTMYNNTSAQNLIYSEDFEGDVSGLTIVGPGDATDGVFEDSGDSNHGIVFHNNPTSAGDVRTRYLQLPSTIFSDAQTAINTSQGLTISFWVNDNGVGVDADGFWWSSMFSAYGGAPSPNNGKPMFQLNTNKRLNVNFDDVMSDGNSYGWFDNIDWGADNLEVVWLDNGGWHFYSIVLTPTSSNVYIDGVLSSTKVADTNNGTRIDGLFNVAGDLTYITLGGNSAWDWGDKDTPFSYDKIKIYDDALTAAQINSLMNTDDIVAAILTVDKSNLDLYNVETTATIIIDGANLTDDITITAPTGITVDPATISKDAASNVTVTVTYDGVTDDLSGDITLTSGTIENTVAVTGNVLESKISGTIIGHDGSWDNINGLIADAFDGNLATFVDAPTAEGFVGYDFGAGIVADLTAIRYAPRSGFESRLVNGEIRGANADDYSDAVTIYTITEAAAANKLTTKELVSPSNYRYIYYYSADGYCNIAELEMYGSTSTATLINKASSGVTIYATDGMIKVKVNSPSDAVIYSLTGKIIKTELVEDTKSIPVSAGLYIVVVNGKATKVVVSK